MRAFRMTRKENPPELADIEPQTPKEGEIGVAIKACGLNFADLLMIDGTYQDMPDTPFALGLEPAGFVTEIGDGVSEFSVGDPVAILSRNGGLAEHGCFEANRAIRIPGNMPFDHAAAFPVAFGTAHAALVHRANLLSGETLLVTGAAGGTGLHAVAVGKLIGARVIAQARGAERLAVAKAAGADHLIDSRTDSLRDALVDIGGADVVYDTVGGETFHAAFRGTNPGGRVLPIGFACGEIPRIPANHLLVKNLAVLGFWLGGFQEHFPDLMRESFRTLLDWYDKEHLVPILGMCFRWKTRRKAWNCCNNAAAREKW